MGIACIIPRVLAAGPKFLISPFIITDHCLTRTAILSVNAVSECCYRGGSLSTVQPALVLASAIGFPQDPCTAHALAVSGLQRDQQKFVCRSGMLDRTVRVPGRCLSQNVMHNNCGIPSVHAFVSRMQAGHCCQMIKKQ